MDWYKHFTNSHDDPDISDAMDIMGDFGYSGFFILLDLYGQEFNHVNGDGFLRISKTFIQRKLRKRWTKVELLLNFFEKEISEPRFLWKDSGSYIELKVPKFIELASNWTGRKIRKDLQSPCVAPTAIEEEEEEEEEKNKYTPSNPPLGEGGGDDTVPKKKRTKDTSTKDKTPYSPTFEKFWAEYPRKTGKKEAFKVWSKIKIDDILFDKILKSLIEQKKHDNLPVDRPKYIPHASTWLNQERWDDEIVYKEKSGRSHYGDDKPFPPSEEFY